MGLKDIVWDASGVSLRQAGSIKDVVDLNGTVIKKTENHILQDADIASFLPQVNVDWVGISRAGFTGIYAQLSGVTPNKMSIPNFNQCSDYTNPDNVSYIGTYVDSSDFSGAIYLIVAKGIYADLAAAKAALIGTSIMYQLQTSVSTQLKRYTNYSKSLNVVSYPQI